MTEQRITFNLLGPQGSGKGTQAAALVEHFGFILFEAGGALRQIIAEGSELGRVAASYMDQGNRVPDELITEVIRETILGYPPEKDILFDGIMRSMGQFALQRKVFEEFGLPLPVIIFLDLDQETAIDRLKKRRICKVCGRQAIWTHEGQRCEQCGGELVIRHDDTPEGIKKRLGLYYRDTVPVIEHMRSLGKVIDVNAKPPIPEVTREVIAKVTRYYQEQGLKPPRN